MVGYTQVQGKVNLKYDAWQKDLQGRFGAILADAIRDTHTQVRQDSPPPPGPRPQATRPMLMGVCLTVCLFLRIRWAFGAAADGCAVPSGGSGARRR